MAYIQGEQASNAFLPSKNTIKDLHILSKIRYLPFNVKVSFSSARESDNPASQTLVLGLVVDFHDFAIVYLACNMQKIIIDLFALLRLRFIGKIPRIQSLGSNISFIPVTCKIISITSLQKA